MQMRLKEVNKLPVRTFRWLNVNEKEIVEELPEINAYTKSPITIHGIPQGVLVTINEKDNELKDLSGKIETGMGQEAVDFVEYNKNMEVTIEIPEKTKMKEPLFLEFYLDDENPVLIEKINVIAKQDSEITIVTNYKNAPNTPVYHGNLMYLFAENNALINLIQVQLFTDKALHFNNIGTRILDSGTVNIIMCELGGKSVVNGINGDLKGDNSKIDIHTIYFGDKSRDYDFNYIVRHTGKNSKSNMNTNGALLDQCKKVFRGTIDFKNGAKGSIGNEEENTLLFSKMIKNISAPLILCKEEEVVGKHAANSGRIDENKLFYMMARGIDEISAKKLMIEAWFEPAIRKIPYVDLQNQVAEYVKERFSHVESI